MANHVYFSVDFNGVSEELWNKSFLSERVARKAWDDSEYTVHELKELHEQPFFDYIPKEYEDDGWLADSWNFYVNNIGAKWCSVESWEHPYLSGYSAWSAPIALVENMVKYFQEHSEETITAKMTYEDEFRNFIGIHEYEGYEEDGEFFVSDDENYVDCEEFQEVLNKKLSEITGQDIDVSEIEMDEELPTLSGGIVIPQEMADDMVYNFWETGRLE